MCVLLNLHIFTVAFDHFPLCCQSDTEIHEPGLIIYTMRFKDIRKHRNRSRSAHTSEISSHDA